MNPLHKEIGRRIAALRKKRGMTQENLADLLQCSVKHVSYVERGTTSFSLEKLIELTRIFDCSMDYLTKGSVPSPVSELPASIRHTLADGSESDRELLFAYLDMYGRLRPIDDH